MFRSLLLFMVVSSFAVALDSEEIISQHSEAVSFTTSDKIYLRPEMIHVTDHGIVLEGETPIVLEALMSDEFGCYVPLASNSQNTGYWFCANPGCPQYQIVKRGGTEYCSSCKFKSRLPASLN